MGLSCLVVGTLAIALTCSAEPSSQLAMALLFPRIVAGGLILSGAVIVLRAPPHPREGVQRFSLWPCITIAGSLMAFAVLIETAGLVLATMTSVLVVTLARRMLSFWQALWFAAWVAAFVALMFIGVLGQAIPLVPRF
ncbi:MAG: tripartite tricarboxylate transporter TctB family protein [Deltaproteobacteria bacterium]